MARGKHGCRSVAHYRARLWKNEIDREAETGRTSVASGDRRGNRATAAEPARGNCFHFSKRKLIESRQSLTGEAVARHYDELDHFYRNIWGEHVHHGLWRRGDESPEIAVA